MDDRLDSYRSELARLVSSAVGNLWPRARIVAEHITDDGVSTDVDVEPHLGDADLIDLATELAQLLVEVDMDPGGASVESISGAYVDGDESKPMVQRIHTAGFPTMGELDSFLEQRDTAAMRDHRRLGEQLDLFAFDPVVGRGLPLWLPHGAAVRDALEDFAKETEHRWGYQRIVTPHITHRELFEISGHLPYFAEDMYPPMHTDDGEVYLRPMNCPHHMRVFAARPHSYRDLPLRYAEYGTVYRYERSGELHGLLRVRGLTQNDAHIFCSLEDAKQEFVDVMRLHAHCYEVLGIEDYNMVLALRDPDNVAKYHGDDEMWRLAEDITREAMDESGIPYVEERGGAAHYGPKVDFVLRTATGLEYAASTNQLDLYLPDRFGLSFTNDRGEAERPAVIHRAPLGSHERFIAFLIEHFAGSFPPWLAPTQVRLIPVHPEQEHYAAEIRGRLLDLRIRVDVARSDGPLGASIRRGFEDKVPYLAVIGPREEASDTVSLRLRGGRSLERVRTAELCVGMARVINSRRNEVMWPGNI